MDNTQNNQTFTDVLENETQEKIQDSGSSVFVDDILKRYEVSVQHEDEYFRQIDDCRRFIKTNIINTTKATGGQEAYQVIRKMSEAHKYPEGSAQETPGVKKEKLPILESLVRNILKRKHLNESFQRSTKDI